MHPFKILFYFLVLILLGLHVSLNNFSSGFSGNGWSGRCQKSCWSHFRNDQGMLIVYMKSFTPYPRKGVIFCIFVVVFLFCFLGGGRGIICWTHHLPSSSEFLLHCNNLDTEVFL